MRTNLKISKGLAFAGLLAIGLSACSIEGTPGGAKVDPYVAPPGTPPYEPPAVQPVDRRVVLLHTNDEHSHLLGFAPMNEYPFTPEADGSVNPATIAAKIGHDELTVGGLVRRQHLINRIRAESADPVLLISAGDVMMGTIFHAATSSAAPDLVAIGLLGYDVMTLGNHELDFGPETLSGALRTADRTLFGSAVPVVASNLHFEDVTDGGSGSDLKALYGEGGSGAAIVPWMTKTLANGLKVGFIGLMGYEAALVSAGKGPIAFSVPAGEACASSTECDPGMSCTRKRCVDPLDAAGHVGAIAAEAQPLVTLLREEQKVDLVVAITHLGLAEDMALAQLTSGIDAIIGGHSHDKVTPTPVNGTVIVQAGDYGRLLGQLTLEISPEGAVSVVEAESLLHEVDSSLDAEIYAGTDLLASPPVLSQSFERGLELTGAVIGPVLGGLNAALGPALGAHLLDPVVASDHDVIGEVPFKDTNLMHLVTDAAFAVVAGGACINPATQPVVAVQANGVIRESLRFGAGGMTTVADIFGVLPLGASPWAAPAVQAPGFPTVMFRLRPIDLFIGADIGVTKGLESDSFFLSYSGMRVHYDPSFEAFDPATFNPMGTAPGGRITKMELGNDQAGWTPIYTYDAQLPWAARWAPEFNPLDGSITVITNLYLAGFLEAFGLSPRDAAGDVLPLPATVLCQNMEPDPNCLEGRPALAPCLTLPGSTTSPVSWQYPEVKEWGLLLKFLTAGLGGTIPAPMYAGDLPASPRVIAVE